MDQLPLLQSAGLKKSTLAQMLAISFPMIISQGCETVMIFTDRLFMSRVGPEEMSATMMGGMSVFMITTFFIGLTGYTNALVAQYFGADRKEQCGLVVSQAGIIAFIGYPLILAATPLVIWYFESCSLVPEQLIPQKTYYTIAVFGSILSLVRNCLSGFFSGIGRTGIVMVAAFISMGVNVVGDWLLIFGNFGFPELGIAGAAYATIIGSICGLLVLVFDYGKYHSRGEFGIRTSWKYDPRVMKTLFRFGYPAGLEMFSNLIAFNLMIMIFHAQGAATATAATIVFNWDLVSFVPLIGIQIGVTSLVGRYMGAGSPDEAHKATLTGLGIGWVYSAIILLLFTFFPEPLVDLFRPAQQSAVFNEARPLAVFMVRLAAVYVMVDTMFAVFTGALRGAGDTFWAMIITGVLHWTLVPLLFVVLRVLKLSDRAGWVSIVMVFVGFGTLIVWRYSSGRWREMKVLVSVAELSTLFAYII